MLRKNNLGKKAQVPEGMLWIVRLLFIVLPLTIAVAFFVKAFILNLDVMPIEAAILSQRAESCFGDGNVIALSGFTQETLGKCYELKNSGAVEVSVWYSDKRSDLSTEKFSLLEPLCAFKNEGSAPYCKEFRKNVIIQDSGKTFAGGMQVKIILKKKDV